MAPGIFPFLELPGEIRNQIYDLCLVRREHTPSHGVGLKDQELGLCPSIIAANRQLYNECSALLYTENWFQAHPNLLTSLPYKTQACRPVTSMACTPLINKFYLEVRLDCDHMWTEDDLAKAFSGVEALHIFAWQASFGTTDIETLERFRKVRRVGKATVEGCGLSEEFAAWLEMTMQSDDDDADSNKGFETPPYQVWEDGQR